MVFSTLGVLAVILLVIAQNTFRLIEEEEEE
jgi:hypothetical protein